MDTLRDAWDRPQLYQTQAKCFSRCQANEIAEKEIYNRARGCNDRGSGKTKRGKCNNRGSLPELVIQHNRCEEK